MPFVPVENALEVYSTEPVEHRLQRLRRVEVLQLVHRNNIFELRPQALLDVAAGRGTLLMQTTSRGLQTAVCSVLSRVQQARPDI